LDTGGAMCEHRRKENAMHRRSRQSVTLALAAAVSILAGTFGPLGAQAAVAKGKAWVVPRTPDGKPDLQGNWSNETQTPLERLGKQGATLTKEEAAAIEERARLVEEFRDKASDPDRPVPVKAGTPKRSPPRANRPSSSASPNPPAARSAAITASGSIPATA
jgi:hypothetical protein